MRGRLSRLEKRPSPWPSPRDYTGRGESICGPRPRTGGEGKTMIGNAPPLSLPEPPVVGVEDINAQQEIRNPVCHNARPEAAGSDQEIANHDGPYDGGDPLNVFGGEQNRRWSRIPWYPTPPPPRSLKSIGAIRVRQRKSRQKYSSMNGTTSAGPSNRKTRKTISQGRGETF